MTFTVSLGKLLWFAIKTAVIVGIVGFWTLFIYTQAYNAGYGDCYDVVKEYFEYYEGEASKA